MGSHTFKWDFGYKDTSRIRTLFWCPAECRYWRSWLYIHSPWAPCKKTLGSVGNAPVNTQTIQNKTQRRQPLLTVMSHIKAGLIPVEADVRARLLFTTGYYANQDSMQTRYSMCVNIKTRLMCPQCVLKIRLVFKTGFYMRQTLLYVS